MGGGIREPGQLLGAIGNFLHRGPAIPQDLFRVELDREAMSRTHGAALPGSVWGQTPVQRRHYANAGLESLLRTSKSLPLAAHLANSSDSSEASSSRRSKRRRIEARPAHDAEDEQEEEEAEVDADDAGAELYELEQESALDELVDAAIDAHPRDLVPEDAPEDATLLDCFFCVLCWPCCWGGQRPLLRRSACDS